MRVRDGALGGGTGASEIKPGRAGTAGRTSTGPTAVRCGVLDAAGGLRGVHGLCAARVDNGGCGCARKGEFELEDGDHPAQGCRPECRRSRRHALHAAAGYARRPSSV